MFRLQPSHGTKSPFMCWCVTHSPCLSTSMLSEGAGGGSSIHIQTWCGIVVMVPYQCHFCNSGGWHSPCMGKTLNDVLKLPHTQKLTNLRGCHVAQAVSQLFIVCFLEHRYFTCIIFLLSEIIWLRIGRVPPSIEMLLHLVWLRGCRTQVAGQNPWVTCYLQFYIKHLLLKSCSSVDTVVGTNVQWVMNLTDFFCKFIDSFTAVTVFFWHPRRQNIIHAVSEIQFFF